MRRINMVKPWLRFVAYIGILACASISNAADRLGPAPLYPNPALTPGLTNPAITQNTIKQTICNHHWSTKSIRPPASYTNKLKRQQLRQYHFADQNPKHYEEDHLISLELGGHPRDPRNLWPESYLTTVKGVVTGAKQKDTVENALHKQVCAGTLSLKEAQQRIVDDWYKEYLAIQKGGK